MSDDDGGDRAAESRRSNAFSISAAAPSLRAARLDQLFAAIGAEAVPELLARLTEDLAEIDRRLAAALPRPPARPPGPDWAEIRAQAHVLIALTGTVGADGLRRGAERLHAAACARDGAAIRRIAPGIRRQLAALPGLLRAAAAGCPA